MKSTSAFLPSIFHPKNKSFFPWQKSAADLRQNGGRLVVPPFFFFRIEARSLILPENTKGAERLEMSFAKN